MGVGLELLLYDLPEDLTHLLCFMIKAHGYFCHLVVPIPFFHASQSFDLILMYCIV